MMKVLYKAFFGENSSSHEEGETQKARPKVLLSKGEQDVATYQVGQTF